MAKIPQGIFGGLSGKIGNLVGSSWKGIPVLKTKPLSVANPRTAAQVAQRNSFTGVVEYAKVILVPVIKPLRDRFAVKMSGFNTFVSDNIAFFDEEGPIVPKDVIISSGSLLACEDLNGSSSYSANEVVLNWTDNSGIGNAFPGDEVYVVIYGSENKDVAGFATPAVRTDATVTITVPWDTTLGETLTCHLSFRRTDGTLVSNSVSVGIDVTP